MGEGDSTVLVCLSVRYLFMYLIEQVYASRGR